MKKTNKNSDIPHKQVFRYNNGDIINISRMRDTPLYFLILKTTKDAYYVCMNLWTGETVNHDSYVIDTMLNVHVEA